MKLFYLILFVVLILVLTACEQKLTEKEICSRMNTYSEQEECFIDLAIRNNNVSFCDLVDNPYIESDCYTPLALNNKNSSMCENIKLVQYKFDCYEELNNAGINLSISIETFKDYHRCEGYCNGYFFQLNIINEPEYQRCLNVCAISGKVIEVN